jgi:hypothetical protein
MILRGTTKPAAFLRCIANTIGRDTREWESVDLSEEALSRGDGAIYLAGGYWRALPSFDSEGRIVGVRLVNPDRSSAECRIVEQAIAILHHFELYIT